MKVWFFLVLSAVFLIACAPEKSSGGYWLASKSQDPVTKTLRCVVTVPDRFGSYTYSQSFRLYPVIEKHSEFGLVVGVSSGGTVRLPVGDILWRVDDRKVRKLLASETPTTAPLVNGVNVAGILASVTLAKGSKARSMLAEMKSGDELVFRAFNPSDGLGLPSSGSQQAGLNVGGKVIPIPIDESFHSALNECGI